MTNQFCPKCKSHLIEGESFDVGENKVTQQMYCQDCDCVYTDVYTLTEQKIEAG